jgi:hypothetical protein
MSRKETLEQFGACWEGLDDPRCGNAALHDFDELLMIALCCVLCGGQGAVDMALFAEAKEPFLRSFLELKNGLPSHDTFSRLFRNLDPDQFRDSFQRFMAQFSEQLEGVVAIDGKVLRRSFDRASGKSALHMVSAWGSLLWYKELNWMCEMASKCTCSRSPLVHSFWQIRLAALSPKRFVSSDYFCLDMRFMILAKRCRWDYASRRLLQSVHQPVSAPRYHACMGELGDGA